MNLLLLYLTMCLYTSHDLTLVPVNNFLELANSIARYENRGVDMIKTRTNAPPFLLLAAVHVLLFFLLTLNRRQKQIWTLLFSNIGLAYFFEYLVLILLKGYSYKPKVHKNNALDQFLGAILSQGFYVPITATLLTLYRKNRYWKLSITLIYYAIERLFLRLKIYKAYWWKPSYTVFFLMVYFSISDWFYRALIAKKKSVLVLAQYLTTEVIGLTWIYLSSVGKKVRFWPRRYHSWHEHFVLAPLYSLVCAVFFVSNSSKKGVLPRLKIFIGLTGMDWIMKQAGLLKMGTNKFWNSFLIK